MCIIELIKCEYVNYLLHSTCTGLHYPELSSVKYDYIPYHHLMNRPLKILIK